MPRSNIQFTISAGGDQNWFASQERVSAADWTLHVGKWGEHRDQYTIKPRGAPYYLGGGNNNDILGPEVATGTFAEMAELLRTYVHMRGGDVAAHVYWLKEE